MRNESKIAIDGFGRELLNPEEIKHGHEPEFSDEMFWGKHKDIQSVFYIHGTLPIFDTGAEIEKEVYTNQHFLLENIKSFDQWHLLDNCLTWLLRFKINN